MQFLRASPNTASRCCIAKRIKNRSHRKCAKHVAASTLYKNKLVIFNAVSFYVSMSPGLPQTFKHKLRSKVKFQTNEPHQGGSWFSKLKCRQFLYKTSNLYILSDSYISKDMLGTKNVR